jgi:hypothetical protein
MFSYGIVVNYAQEEGRCPHSFGPADLRTNGDASAVQIVESRGRRRRQVTRAEG